MTQQLPKTQGLFVHVDYVDMEEFLGRLFDKNVQLVPIMEWGNDTSYGPFSADDPYYDKEQVETWLAVPKPDIPETAAAWERAMILGDWSVKEAPSLGYMLSYLAEQGKLDKSFTCYVDVMW